MRPFAAKKNEIINLVIVLFCLSSSFAYAKSGKLNLTPGQIVEACRPYDSISKAAKLEQCGRKLMRSYPERSWGYYTVSTAKYYKKDYQSAINFITQGNNKNGEQSEEVYAKILSGRIYTDVFKFDLAEFFFKSALSDLKKSKAYSSTLMDGVLEGMARMLAIRARYYFFSNYKNVEIGMPKKRVLELIGLVPDYKRAVSYKKGVFECWGWRNNNVWTSLLFLDDSVVETGIIKCPDVFSN